MTQPYNPLDKDNLARSIEAALLDRDAVPLDTIKGLKGAGVYALYYDGDFAPYAELRSNPARPDLHRPIYVGKAIPKGGRTGGLDKDASTGDALNTRLRIHRRSIDQASNLSVEDFRARFLLIDDIWIPLGESVLIKRFQPLWNAAIFGFGNNAPGAGRDKQVRSPWDVLHPGRTAFSKLPDGGLTNAALIKRVADHLAGRPLDPLPASVQKLVEAVAEDVNAALET